MNDSNTNIIERETTDRLRKPYPATGKLLVRASLELVTPAIIGNGKSDNSDMDILREPVRARPGSKTNGESAAWIQSSPLIPATSIIGVFRAYLERHLRGRWSPEIEKAFKYLFGYLAAPEEKEEAEKKKTEAFETQSALQCDDILLPEAKVTIRDGVAIDHRKNIALDKQKFAYEVMEYRKAFDLKLEVTLRKGHDDAEAVAHYKKLLFTIFHGIEQGHIRIGAKSNKGFGRLGIKDNAIKIAELHFRNPEHFYLWLRNDPNGYVFDKISLQDIDSFAMGPSQFRIDAWFRIKNSLLIRSYSADPQEPDGVHMQSNGRFLMPGTSVMGAVRHRAKKILKTLDMPDAAVEHRMRHLFGYEGEKRTGAGACKGRLRIEETTIQNPLARIQTRIKIDRFTGGTLHGALFETMPLWRKGQEKAVHVAMTLTEYDDWQAGLLLLILKDLWAGDLAIGGDKSVGRGVLEGVSATITWPKGEVELAPGPNGVLADSEKQEKLEAFVKKLNEEIQNAKEKAAGKK